jgi:uncharacterized membrane protein
VRVSVDLVDRLDRLERELARLEGDVRGVRALVAEGEREGVAVERAVAVEPEPPPVPETPVAPVPKPAVPVTAARPAAAPTPAPTAAAPTPAPAAATPKPAWRPPPTPPRPPRRSLGQLARDWDLVGPRGFAIVGGAVLALGIGFFFVLAANRGWIGEGARIALGAAASTAALAAGIWLRSRYGQYWAALGAVGAGIAGAYATLAAATARYDVVPDALGLPIAGVIAAVGTVIAVRWHSQVIAGIGLLGAALAPALQALDTDLTWESVAFALIVLAAAASVCVPRSWHMLLGVATAVVALQGLWLVSAVEAPAEAGTVAVTVALAAILLAIATGLQLSSERRDLEALALTYALLAFGVPLATVSRLFEDRPDRGLAFFGISLVWLVAFALLAWRRKADLALVVAVSGLGLTAVGTALLLSDSALAIAWATEAVALAVLAWRFSDARLHVTGIAYAGLAAVYTLGSDAVPGTLFDSLADHGSAVLPLAASAAAFVATGFATRSSFAVRTETGLLGFLGDLRRTLEQYRLGVRESLVFTGTALATLAVSFALVGLSFERGHVVATAFAALVGAAILGLAGALRRDGLAVAAYLWLGSALVLALGYDVPELYDDVSETSLGGWSAIAVATALAAGAYAHRIQWEADRVRDIVAGIAFGAAAATSAFGIALVTTERVPGGLGLLAVGAAYFALAAGVFRRPELRDVATTLWSLGLVLVIGAEALLVGDPVWRAAAIAATSVAVAALASPLEEERLWLAGWALAVATSATVLLVQVQPWVETELPRKLALATGAGALAALAVAALRWGEARRRDLVTALWVVGLLGVLATERVLVADDVWLAVVVAATAAAVAALARPLREERIWLAAGALVVITTAAVLLEQTRPWLDEAELGRRLALASGACALAAFVVAALRWGLARYRDLVTVVAATGVLALLATERILLGDFRATAIAFALTGGALALAASPLREPRAWTGGALLVGVTLVATLVQWTPPSHLLVASADPADGLWVLLACLVGLAAVAATSPDLPTRVALEGLAGGIALYALSLGILEVAERVSGGSIQTDFERGHTAVSGLWALVGLALLVVGLLRGSTAIRYGGLALFGLSLAKIFLYDLASLSSVARAFSFILVGGLLLAGGFFLQRLSDRLGPPRAS